MITSLGNRKIEGAVKLKKRAYREREHRFLVEGAQAVGEALAKDAGLEVLFHTDPAHPIVGRASARDVPALRVSDEVMARLTSTVTPQGLVGIAPFVDVPLTDVPDQSGCVALLHSVRDPGNAGTVLRSADAAGAGGVIFSSSSVDVYNPKTVRASAGSLFHLPVVRGVDTAETLGALRQRGFQIAATAADGERDLYETDLGAPTAFLLGNEAWGVPDELAAEADFTLRVPIAGRAESLNLAAAATICLFEWARQIRQGRRAALETLVTAAAHDIRSPLTAMKGFGFALKNRWAAMTEDQRNLMLDGIVYDTERLDMIVRQLVDAARLTAGSLELYPERTDVGEIVSLLASHLERDPEHPPIHWNSGAVEAFIDGDRLRTALSAFLEAEVWWTREGPIEITGRVESGRLIVEVFRRGTDLGHEQAEALFQPRRPGTGSGSKMGLFVTRGVAEAQGGTAQVRVQEGLRFRLELPLPPPLD